MLRSLKHKLGLAFKLSPSEWLNLVEAWGSLLGFWLALRWRSFDSVTEARYLIPSGKTVAPVSLDSMQRLYQLVGWASHLYIMPMACLEKSLALQWMLRRRGVNAQLKIGAHKVSEGISAHAWVEVSGQVIGESEGMIENFKVLKPIFSPKSKRT